MIYLFAICCFFFVYYNKDDIWDSLCETCLLKPACKATQGDELTIHETLKLQTKFALEQSSEPKDRRSASKDTALPYTAEPYIYITNYSINHKTYSIHTTQSSGFDDILIKQYTDSVSGKKLLRKIIFAELRGLFGKEDVTPLIKSAQGLKCDFHKEVRPETILWDHILYEYDLDSWDVLTLVDSFGHIHNIPMKDADREIVWNPEFAL